VAAGNTVFVGFCSAVPYPVPEGSQFVSESPVAVAAYLDECISLNGPASNPTGFDGGTVEGAITFSTMSFSLSGIGEYGVFETYWCNDGGEFYWDPYMCVPPEGGGEGPECPVGTWVYDTESLTCVPSEWEGINVEEMTYILTALGLVVCVVLGFIASRLR